MATTYIIEFYPGIDTPLSETPSFTMTGETAKHVIANIKENTLLNGSMWIRRIRELFVSEKAGGSLQNPTPDVEVRLRVLFSKSHSFV